MTIPIDTSVARPGMSRTSTAEVTTTIKTAVNKTDGVAWFLVTDGYQANL